MYWKCVDYEHNYKVITNVSNILECWRFQRQIEQIEIAIGVGGTKGLRFYIYQHASYPYTNYIRNIVAYIMEIVTMGSLCAIRRQRCC